MSPLLAFVLGLSVGFVVGVVGTYLVALWVTGKAMFKSINREAD